MATRKQRLLKHGAYLGIALALLAVAAWIMMEPAAPRRERAALEFPRYPRAHEIERQRQRSTFVPVRRADAGRQLGPARGPSEYEGGQDPVHVALGAANVAVVLEASTLLDSPLGRMLLACLSPEQSAELAAWEQKSGFRPREQLERIAIGGAGAGDDLEPVLALSGDFRELDPKGLAFEGQFEPYGQKSRLIAVEERAMAVWDDQLLLLGEPENVLSALARLEGELPALESPLAGEAYGEIYGTLSSSAASRFVPSELRERLLEATERVTLHVDASDDLLMVAQVYGKDRDKLRDLATAIGGALSLGRLHAVREEDALLADLLDESRVIPDEETFQLEMALPLASIEAQLGACAVAARKQ